MTTVAIYAQFPINIKHREIRLFVLAPGSSNDVLRVELITESLDYDDLHYTALSYTWSGPRSGSPIFVGDLPLPITKNLELALRRIRDCSRPKTLWVDAICINQDDDVEKSLQVALMGEIYASATRTWIWLGKESEDSDIAMDFVASFQTDGTEDLDREGTPWQSLTRLLERAWWTRVWVVQEVILAPRARLQCGGKHVDFTNFVRLVRYLKRCESFEFRKVFQGRSFTDILSKWYTYKEQAENRTLSIWKLVSLTHKLQASVHEDKLYALLGLAPLEIRSYVTPEYSTRTPDHVRHTRLTVYLLKSSAKLSLVLWCASRCRAIGAPSWVVDWTDSSSIRLFDNSRAIEFREVRDKAQLEDQPESETYRKVSSCFSFERKDLLDRDTEEPPTLLIFGVMTEQVQAVLEIPTASSDDRVESEKYLKPAKAKIKDWEIFVTNFYKEKASQDADLKACLNYDSGEDGVSLSEKYLLKYMVISQLRPDLYYDYWKDSFARHADRRLKDLFEGFMGLYPRWVIKDVVDEYDAWMAMEGPQSSDFRSSDSQISDPQSSDLRSPDLFVFGNRILDFCKGKTVILADRGCQFIAQKTPVRKGDTICGLGDYSLIVLREFDEDHWTLVGHEFGPRTFSAMLKTEDFGLGDCVRNRQGDPVFKLR